MDAVFSLMSPSDRNSFLRSFLWSFGGAYICLWSYSPQPTHHLFFRDGYLYEDNTQPGSSAPSLSRRLFDEYCHEMFFLVNGRVPGLAFVNNQPYRELNQFELQTMSSIAVQRQFYQQAKIKTAVFLGCGSGEIEMGWSNGVQVNMENSIRTWFSSDVILQRQSAVDPNRVSSTSSSPTRSFSIDSPENTSLLFNLPSSTSHIPEIISLEPSTSLQPIPSTSSSPLHEIMQHMQPTNQTLMQSLQQQQLTTTVTAATAPILQQMQPLQLQQLTATATTAPLLQQQMEALVRNISLPNQQSVDEAITRAILAVLTSPSPSLTTSSSFRSPTHPLNPKASAFKKYRAPTSPARHNLLRQTMLKRSIIYYRSLNIARRENLMSSTRPTTTQLHHMISERKRREKINDSFEALRKLLPPESKKDKASVLTRTREYLLSLRDQAEKLSERNRELEGQLLLPVEDSSSERVGVRITHVTESTSEEQRIINLQVVLRGESSVSDMVVRILEFLRQDHNVNLISMEASTLSEDSKRVILRLKIEGNEWDESAFQEAIKRVVADLL